MALEEHAHYMGQQWCSQKFLVGEADLLVVILYK